MLSKYTKYLRLSGAAVLGALILFLFIGTFFWMFCRVYVPEGYSMQLRYKVPLVMRFNIKVAEKGQFAKDGEIGVLGELKGPGRYFYWPIWWERTVVPDQVVLPGQVGLCTCQLGESLPEGEFLVDGDLGTTEYKGIMRRVFPPGRYRAHPYAYKFEAIDREQVSVGNQVKYSGWIEVPAGYVGVVTYMADNPKADNPDPAMTGRTQGIQPDVLPPGLYMINPKEQQVDIVEIGFRETTIVVDKQVDASGQRIVDESGETLPVPKTGIAFPSDDGFDIHMDFTAIWGVMPDQAPEIINQFGNVDLVEEKVIIPQSESIALENGSKFGAVELLIGDSRQQFQDETSKQFLDILEKKDITLLYGLVRHIYIPTEVRIPIQEGYVAEELKLTREQERDTAKTEAQLREAEEIVKLEATKVEEETKKMVAQVEAEGQKEAEEIAAETEKQVAAIDRLAAELDAKRTVVIGEADALAQKMQEQAKADKFRLAVESFGNADAYTRWQFAEGLPEDIELQLLYAGEGTLWTDLENVTPIIPLNERKK